MLDFPALSMNTMLGAPTSGRPIRHKEPTGGRRTQHDAPALT